MLAACGEGRNGLQAESADAHLTLRQPIRYDSGSGPCVVLFPMAQRHRALRHRWVCCRRLRVVCFDMPGFGLFPVGLRTFLDQGAKAVVGCRRLGIGQRRGSLCEQLYALRAARVAPDRISDWCFLNTVARRDTCVDGPSRSWPLRVPVVDGAAWSRREGRAQRYRIALPGTTDAGPFQEGAAPLARSLLFLAGVVQGLARETRVGDQWRPLH
jgi:hypothetical protein